MAQNMCAIGGLIAGIVAITAFCYAAQGAQRGDLAKTYFCCEVAKTCGQVGFAFCEAAAGDGGHQPRHSFHH